ncbi:ABC transporter permease [Micromonospora sp. NPDC047730]|uniref:ABC transporter permease n=1 Tax=Micromonospora sp. NPDC047730 TaxID=3364253 RepID=UPI0037156D93
MVRGSFQRPTRIPPPARWLTARAREPPRSSVYRRRRRPSEILRPPVQPVGLPLSTYRVTGAGCATRTMISVRQRRAEVEPRRALGATRGQIRVQFLAEALLLSVLGGIGGTLLGAGITALYAYSRQWPTVVPAWAMAGGLGATVLVGTLAGRYPAIRASRLPPTTALAGP